MKCLQLSRKSRLRLSDSLTLAKAPLIPYQYLIKQKGANLGLLQGDEKDTFLLVTDKEEFLETFRSYFEDRFEVEEKEQGYAIPDDFQVIYGQVDFGGGAPSTASDEGEEEDEEPAETSEGQVELTEGEENNPK